MTTLYQIPICPFSQRLNIMLALKQKSELVDFHIVDITVPRPEWLLEKSRGTTALPILELDDGTVLKESMVILNYLEGITQQQPLAQQDPKKRAIENMLCTLEGPFAFAGYSMILNQQREKKAEHEQKLLSVYREMNDFLLHFSESDDYLFEDFGWAETVFTPLMMRFWFLEYYEGFELPATEEFARVRRWQALCLSHPKAQQVTKEEVIKLYYDYAKGAGNGALVAGRSVSSFTFEPHWSRRPWPPSDKYGVSASDIELGLVN